MGSQNFNSVLKYGPNVEPLVFLGENSPT